MQRRVARTKAAIEDALVQAVLERGYEQITVEDISERADLARATTTPTRKPCRVYLSTLGPLHRAELL
jgi:hypothetical protein